VTIALGYDSGPPGSSAQELIRLLEAGLSVTEGLRAATLGGAAALGRDDLGRLGVGARADAVAVDGRPDEDPAVLTRPEAIRLVVGRGRSSRTRAARGFGAWSGAASRPAGGQSKPRAGRGCYMTCYD
jgi:imidazolonepropionase-like amidohydrolase